MPRSRARVDLALGERRREAERELVLDGDDLDDAQRLLELLDGAVGEADPAHLALVLELLERADGLGVGHVRDRGGGTGRGRCGRCRARAATPRRPRGCARGGRRAPTRRRARMWPALVATITSSRRPCEGLGDQPLVVADLALVARSRRRRCRSGSRRRRARRGWCGSTAPRRGGRRAPWASRRGRSGRRSVPARPRVLFSIVVITTVSPERLPTNGRGGRLARAHGPVHVAAPALRVLRARPVERPDRRAQRAAERRPRAGRQVAAVAPAGPLLVGPLLLVERRRAARPAGRTGARACRARRRGGRPAPTCRARARGRPRGTRAARRASRRAASCRRSPSPGPASRARLAGQAVAAPERLVVDGVALDHRALRRSAG